MRRAIPSRKIRSPARKRFHPRMRFACRATPLSLFLEATQRKTVPTETAVLWEDPIEAEVQEVSIRSTRNRRRPVVTTGADAPQLARSIRSTDTAVAVARGRTHRVFCWSFHCRFFFLFLEATQRKTVRTAIVVLRADPTVAEAQEVGIGARNRRRPAVPVAADAPQHTGAVRAVARGRGRVAFPYSWRQRNGKPFPRPLTWCG